MSLAVAYSLKLKVSSGEVYLYNFIDGVSVSHSKINDSSQFIIGINADIIFEVNRTGKIINAYKFRSMQLLYTLDFPESIYSNSTRINFTSNGKYFTVKIESECFQVRDCRTGVLIKKFYGLNSPISNNLKYHIAMIDVPEDKVPSAQIDLANLPSFDSYIPFSTYIYLIDDDSNTGSLLPFPQILDNRFSRDNKYLYYSSPDKISIYECASGQLIREIETSSAKLTYNIYDEVISVSINRSEKLMEFHSINIATGKLTKTLPSLHPPVILGTTHNNHKNFGVIFQKSPTSRQGFEFTFHEKIIDCDYVAAKSIMPLNSIIKLLTSILILKKSLARSYPSALPQEIIKEIIGHLLRNLLPIVSSNLINYMYSSAGEFLEKDEFIEGFYESLILYK